MHFPANTNQRIKVRKNEELILSTKKVMKKRKSVRQKDSLLTGNFLHFILGFESNLSGTGNKKAVLEVDLEAGVTHSGWLK